MDGNVSAPVRELRHLRIGMPEVEFLHPGHMGCAGCGAIHAMRYALKVLGKKVVVVVSASCWSGICAALKVPYTHCAFMSAGAWASGVRAGLDVRGDKETTVLAWAGDGGTFDIGIQSLSGAAERNADFLYICNDNEAYMNTGIQRSSATPMGAWTTTTPSPRPKEQPKKNITEIMAAHRIPYVATATLAYPEDFMRKVEKAKAIRGTRFIHVLSPCPTGWRFPPGLTVKISRLAVQSRVFPVYEIENGKRYFLQRALQQVPVKDYLGAQGRFSQLTEEDMAVIQGNVDEWWEQLLARASSVTGLPR